MPDGMVELPLQTREVRLLPETVNRAARTVELVWSTGAAVRRRDFWTGKRYEEVLSLDPAHVDLSRLNNGAPLLNTHGAFDLASVIGVVERAWIARTGDGHEGRAVVRFSEREDVAPVWRDVEGGIIRNVSVGYAVRAYEITEEDGKLPVWRAIDWQPLELSAVPIGADPNAGFRSRQGGMPCLLVFNRAAPAHQQRVDDMDLDTNADAAAAIEQRAAAEPPANPGTDGGGAERVAESAVQRLAVVATPVPVTPAAPAPSPAVAANTDTAAVADRARAVERERVLGIYDAARKLAVPQATADDLVQRGIGLDEARRALIDAAAARDRAIETRPHVGTGGQDERVTRRASVEVAILHRFDPGTHKLTDAAREWRGYSLIEMGRAFLEAEGVRTRGLARDEIATRALHSTSDFPHILANVANKTLRAAYEAAPRTFQPIARQVNASDFKEMKRVQLGEAPQLEKVNQSGEFKRGTVGEAAEAYRIETFGKVVAINRQVIINDDLDAFTRVPQLFGVAAATLESDTVWGIITSNPNMADGVALFHANHKNLAGTGTALDVANVGKARAAMAKQTGLDGKTILNIRPMFLVIGSTLELTAEQLIAQNLTPAKTGDVVPNSIRSLAVISEPRLDPASGAIPWYLFASPGQIDTIEYAYLDGQQGVFIETRIGFDVDGVEIKARLDFGAKAIDWRGLHKNPGVAP